MPGRHAFAEALGCPARALVGFVAVVTLLAIPVEGAAAASALPSIGSVVRVQTGAPGQTVVGTLTVTEAMGPGFATVYGCADGWPLASNVNFQRGWTFANRVVAHADDNGELCIYLHQWAHVIWDQTAVLDGPVHAPQRLLDTRHAGVRPPDGAVVVVDTGAPGRTVQGNLTVTEAAGPGYATVYPCAAGRPGTSNVNYGAGWTVANAVVERADAQGLLCVYVYRSAHVVWDQTSEADEPPDAVHAAVRRLDTRLGSGPVPDGEVVRIQTGAPGAARA